MACAGLTEHVMLPAAQARRGGRGYRQGGARPPAGSTLRVLLCRYPGWACHAIATACPVC
eukprot:1614021-Rhodomonas_salina.3